MLRTDEVATEKRVRFDISEEELTSEDLEESESGEDE